jgi:coenzyme F420-dependent glucose-6-phosphate dehydrogenase
VSRYYPGCMHEQYHPAELLRQAVVGEQAGFDGIACSDHFQPWREPGHSGHAWIWLGAAAQATESVPVGPAVTVALKRYHPALVAQGFATLEAMYPRRVFVGLGSGESLNESPLGLDWPPPRDQLAALEEACGLIRRLWDGEHVDQDGRFFRTKRRTCTRGPTSRRRSMSPRFIRARRKSPAATATVSGRCPNRRGPRS